MSDRGASAPYLRKQLGKYVIEDVLGRGGMGTVYKARDPRMDRVVAIKTLNSNIGDESSLKRFYREAEKTGRLKHANIITIYDLGEENGQPYIVMEFVEGRALDSIIRDPNDIPLLQKLQVIEQVCTALGYAHSNDVIHRDVKPANVMVCQDGLVKLLDFGIAMQERTGDMTLTQTGLVIGTVPYMAPERLHGNAVDGRSDIFAIGVLLFQLLTRELPFQGDELVLVNKLLHEQHPPLSRYLANYPKGLDEIVDKALKKLPEERYESAEEMAADLSAVVEEAKHKYVSELLLRAKEHLKAHDTLPARELFIEVLKLDPQQSTARRMLAELNQHISRQQQIEHADLKRRQAENALLEKNYEAAIPLLEEAARLAPDDADIANQLQVVRQKKKTADLVTLALRQAEEAKRSGDISKALAIVQEALNLDSTNPRARVAYNALVKESKQSEQRAAARRLLQRAREQLASKKYEAALELIREAEQLDPANVEIQSITKAAREEVRLVLRRSRIVEVEELIAAAQDEEHWSITVAAIQNALTELPSDPLLLRYKLQADQQMKEIAETRELGEIVGHSWVVFEVSPGEALSYLEGMLQNRPRSEQLLALAAEFRSRIDRHRKEEMHRDYLLRARQALDAQNFALAAEILEACQAESYSSDVAELLDFARTSEAEKRFKAAAVECQEQVLRLISEGNLRDAVTELQAVLRDGYDSSLTSLLEQAQSSLNHSEKERNGAWTRVQELINRRFYQQALLAIESLPSEWHFVDAQATRSRCEDTMQREFGELQRIGRAYGSLHSADPNSDWTDESGATTLAGVPQGLWMSLMEHRKAVAIEALHQRVRDLQSVRPEQIRMLAGDLGQTERFTSYASKEAKRAWTAALWNGVWRSCVKSISERRWR